MSAEAWVRQWWAGRAGAAGAAATAAFAPAEGLFRTGVAARNAAYDRGWMRAERVAVPVISIGNLAVGGAGKTPFAAWIAARLLEWGRTPAIALRGYGEDEVILHRELNPTIPVFSAAKRADAAREAVAAGRDVVVLDDGFQHRALARDLDVVLIAAESWTAQPRLLPRGPWREGLGALARAGVIVLTRKTAPLARAEEIAALLGRMQPTTPVAICALTPAPGLRMLHGGGLLVDAGMVRGHSVLAVAALATPEPFLEHARQMAAEVDAALFRDHHAFTRDDVTALLQRAAGRPVLMTQKDAVKLRELIPAGVDAYVVEQHVTLERGGDALDAALRTALEARG
ncbi:MAG TPA: tetraacyldisaccharide 4'-kinase [Longimicrobium sp.]|nr:tetraacyldisaccharide 4'-kinase [Longimicrobium sp.]